MPKFKDLTGEVFGRLTAKEIGERRVYTDGSTRYFWLCECECGNTKTIASNKLISGHTQSCGCLRTEKTVENNKVRVVDYSIRNKSYGKDPLFAVWRSIKCRCENPNVNDYKSYGGRGITMCDEWSNSFESFRGWANSKGYTKGLSVDRIDNNSVYSPVNCRLTDLKTQANNRRTTAYATGFGETKSLTQWSRDNRCEVSLNYLRTRFIEKGLSLEVAIKKDIRA